MNSNGPETAFLKRPMRPPMKIDIDELKDGSLSLALNFDVGIGLGNVSPEDIDEHDVHLLAPTVCRTSLKLNEAQYFHRMARRFVRNEAATHYHFNSFVTALRSVMDVLANEGPKNERFRSWLAEARSRLQKNQEFIRFVDLRNKSVHQGIQPPRLAFGAAFKEHLDGGRTVEPVVDLVGINGKEIRDPFGAMERALDAVKAVVDEALAKGFISRTKKAGHAMQVRFLKEVEPGKWREASMAEMAMFDPSKNQRKVKPS